MDLGQPAGEPGTPADATQPGTGRLPVRLRVQLGAHIGQVYTMSGDTLTIGRAPDNDLVLDDVQVSRYHARLLRRGNEVILEDLGSTNGSLVNGRRISGRHALQPTETIAIGSTVFSVEGFAAPDTLGMVPVSSLSRERQPSAASATPRGPSEPPARGGVPWPVIVGLAGLLIVVILILALGGMLSFLLSTQATPIAPSVPSIFVQSPVAGSEVRVNQPVTVSAIASDANGVSRVELWVAGVLVAQQQVAEGQLATTLPVELRWTPTAPGGYTLQIKAYNTLGAVSQPTALLVIAVPEPSAGVTSTPGDANTDGGRAIAVTTADLNVRAGPGQDFLVLGLAPAGTELEVVGRNPEGTWWQVIYPTDSDGRGWVFANFTRAENTDNVPVVVTPVPTPAAPTATPPPSPTYTRVVVTQPRPSATPTPEPTPAPTPVSPTGPVVELSVTRSPIGPGECATLQWHIENIRAAFLSGGDLRDLGITGPYGSREVCLSVTTTYVLRADTESGIIERSATIEVVATNLPNAQTITLNAASVTVNNEGTQLSGAAAGDDADNRGMRVIVSFDLSPLRSATIGAAQLDLAAFEVVGNPFVSLGLLAIDNLDYQAAPSLENYARQAPLLATIDAAPRLSQPVDLTNALTRAVDMGAPALALRLGFANDTNQNNSDDYVRWNNVRLLVQLR